MTEKWKRIRKYQENFSTFAEYEMYNAEGRRYVIKVQEGWEEYNPPEILQEDLDLHESSIYHQIEDVGEGVEKNRKRTGAMSPAGR